MSQAGSTSNKPANFWWGLGANVESQAIVMGVSTMMTRMFASTNMTTSCVIRVSSTQFGPGLGGGGGDVVLVIATGIASPSHFPMAKADGGWSLSFRDVVAWSSTPKSCFELAHLIRTVPTKDILDFAVKNPAYFGKLKEAVGAFYNTMIVGKDAVLDLPRLWMFPLAGVGFELGVTYRCVNPTELVAL
jgi:hypothetical protein